MTNRPGMDRPRWRLSHVALALMALVLTGGLFLTLGWIGLGILGLFGLVIAQNLDLYGDNPAAQFPGTLAVHHAAQEQARRRRHSPEEKAAESARHDQKRRLLYIVNTVCLSLTALGFSMFFLYQL